MDELPVGAEIDALVAERVMGWHRVEHPDALDPAFRWKWYDAQGRYGHEGYWNPSAELSYAWQVVKHLRLTHHFALISRGRMDGRSEHAPAWQAEFCTYGAIGQLYRAIADTPELAICRAALQTLDISGHG